MRPEEVGHRVEKGFFIVAGINGDFRSQLNSCLPRELFVLDHGGSQSQLVHELIKLASFSQGENAFQNLFCPWQARVDVGCDSALFPDPKTQRKFKPNEQFSR